MRYHRLIFSVANAGSTAPGPPRGGRAADGMGKTTSEGAVGIVRSMAFPSLMVTPVRLQTSHAGVRAATLEIWRLVKYGVVGLSNIAVSLAVMNLFFLFVHPTSPQMLVLGSSLGYLAGDVNSYWWNRGFTFGLPRATRGSALRFALVSLVAMSINAGMVWGYADLVLHSFLPVWLQANLSQVSATISGGIGYLACRLWVFRTTGTM